MVFKKAAAILWVSERKGFGGSKEQIKMEAGKMTRKITQQLFAILTAEFYQKTAQCGKHTPFDQFNLVSLIKFGT